MGGGASVQDQTKDAINAMAAASDDELKQFFASLSTESVAKMEKTFNNEQARIDPNASITTVVQSMSGQQLLGPKEMPAATTASALCSEVRSVQGRAEEDGFYRLLHADVEFKDTATLQSLLHGDSQFVELTAVFDPVRWKFLGDATWKGRYGAAMVVLPDGDVLLMGGANAKQEVWRFNPLSKAWLQLGHYPYDHGSSDVVVSMLPEGDVLLVGGSGYSTFARKEVWRFSPASDSWTRLRDAPWEARIGAATATLAQGDILFMGGHTFDKIYNDVWRFSASEEQWNQLQDVPWEPTFGARCAVLPGGDVLLLGAANSSQVWRLVPSTGVWRQLQDAPWQPRSSPSVVTLLDGRVLFLGGQKIMGGMLNDVWVFSDCDASWTQLADAPWEPRDHAAVAVLNDGNVLIAAGQAGSPKPNLNDVWLYVA